MDKNKSELNNSPANIIKTEQEPLNSKAVLLEEEDKSTFNKLKRGLITELRPIGALEKLLVDKIIADFWRLGRFLKIETATMDWWRHRGLDAEKERHIFSGGEEFIESTSPDQINRNATRNMICTETDDTEKLLRYENSIERSISKNLHELQRLQAARIGKQTLLPAIVDINVSNE